MTATKAKKKLPFHNKYSYVPGAGREINNDPSLTQPGEALTIQDLIRKYRAADMFGIEGNYFDPGDIDKINEFYNPGALDLTDMDRFRDHVDKMNKAYQTALDNQKKEAENAKEKKASEETPPTETDSAKPQADPAKAKSKTED